MDYSRHCYVTEAKLWRDRDTLTPIKWFRASDDADFFPHPHAYGSIRTWEMGEDNVGNIGERPTTFQYHLGGAPTNFPGDHFCGRQEAFLDGGETDVDLEMQTDANGSTPCCSVPIGVALCGFTHYPTLPFFVAFESNPLGTAKPLNGLTATLAPLGKTGFLTNWWTWGVEGLVLPSRDSFGNARTMDIFLQLASETGQGCDPRVTVIVHTVHPIGLPVNCSNIDFHCFGWTEDDPIKIDAKIGGPDNNMQGAFSCDSSFVPDENLMTNSSSINQVVIRFRQS